MSWLGAGSSRSTAQPSAAEAAGGARLRRKRWAGIGAGSKIALPLATAQNEFSITHVGTVTSTLTFFREIGASLGSALVGSLFTAGLAARLAANLSTLGGTSALGVKVNSLTPEIADALPAAVHRAVARCFTRAPLGYVRLRIRGPLCEHRPLE